MFLFQIYCLHKKIVEDLTEDTIKVNPRATIKVNPRAAIKLNPRAAATDIIVNPSTSHSDASSAGNTVASVKKMPTSALVPESDLVITKYIQNLGLVFNKKAKLLICVLCKAGITPSTAHHHLSTPKKPGVIFDQDRDTWVKQSNTTPEVAHNTGKLPTSKELCAGIIDSLLLDGHISASDQVLDYIKVDGVGGWLDTAMHLNPPHEKYSPVEGIAVYPHSLKCIVNESKTVNGIQICGYIVRAMASMQVHWSKKHTTHNNKPLRKTSTASRWSKVTAQTLLDHTGRHYFFSVFRPASQPVKPDNLSENKLPDSFSGPLDSTDPLYLEHLTKLLKAQKNSVMGELDLSMQGDKKTMLPILADSRIAKFIEKHGDLRKPLDPAFANDPIKAELYAKLRKAVLRSFLNDCEFFNMPTMPIHGDVLSLMTNAGRRGESPRKTFSLLTNIKSITAYAIIEAKFLWAMLNANKSSGLFMFNIDQQSLLDTVKKLLHKSTEDNIELINELGKLVRSIYFPKDNANYYAQDIFFSPIIAFTALQCWDGKQYLNIFHIPPILAKIQYLIRMRAVPVLHAMQANIPSTKEYFK